MYNDDTKEAYSVLLDYIESKYEFENNEDFKNKFQELLETDEEFQVMINKFNNVNVYNEDRVNTVEDFLNLGEKLFPVEEEIKEEKVEEKTEINKTEAPKVSSKESKLSLETIESPRIKVPFYKKAINFIKEMPDFVKIPNAVSLGTFGILSVFNLIGGGGLFYVAATGLIIPAITASVYAGRAIYNSYKYGKIRSFLNKKNKDYEPLPSLEMVETKDKEITKEVTNEEINEKIKENDIYFPDFDIEETESKEEIYFPDVEAVSEIAKSIDLPAVEPVETSIEDKPLEEVPSYDPTKEVPTFEKDEKHQKVETETKKEENIIPEVDKEIKRDNSEVEVKIESKEEKEVKKEYKPRHMKKNTKIYEDGYKEKRIAELESELDRLKDVKRTLEVGPIGEENDAKKELVSRMIKENSQSIEKSQKELNELKGVKEEKNLAKLLRARKATLTGKLSKIPDTKENAELRSSIKVAISQIDKYINLDKQIRNNSLATEADKNKLKDMENTTYMTVEYIMDETRKMK